MHDIAITASAQREIERLERSLADRILARIAELADNPRPRGTTKLKGSTSLYRVRVGGWRIVYEVDDTPVLGDDGNVTHTGTVLVTQVAHRREVYRR